MVRQPVEWTGLYFGANAGYGWGKYSSNITFSGRWCFRFNESHYRITPRGSSYRCATELSGTRVPGSGSPSGAIAGGQIGFNWQAGMFVFGGEIDGQWSGQENTFSAACGPGCTATESIKIRSLATGRGRFGLAFDWFMPYVTGGAAMVNGLNNLTMTVGGTTASFAPLSHTTLGWTAGAGVEVALWSNWSAKLEYLYVSANGATKLAPIPECPGPGLRLNARRLSRQYRSCRLQLPVRPPWRPRRARVAASGARRLCVERRFPAEPAVCDRPGERTGRGGQPSKKSGPSSGQAGRHPGCRSSGRAGSERSGTGREASRRPEASSSTASRLRHKRAAVLDGR